MAAQTLLIADNNEDFRLALEKQLQSRYAVRSCRSGKEALEILRQNGADLLVLDLMLPELDGITLLERITAENIRPMVLVITSMVTDYVLTSSQRLGIGYIMLKPCDLQAVCARIADLNTQLNPPAPTPDPYCIASRLLTDIGFAAKMKGFPCLKEAVVQMERDPHQAVTKELYPAVAKALGKNASQVEKSIRNAIHTIWKRHGKELWAPYFPNAEKAPSNALFLAQMAEALHRAME